MSSVKMTILERCLHYLMITPRINTVGEQIHFLG